jgi:hypothetical protein
MAAGLSERGLAVVDDGPIEIDDAVWHLRPKAQMNRRP